MAAVKDVSKAEIVSLTSLRGIAAWWVALYHISDIAYSVIGSDVYLWLSKGYLAVDLFFVLSGFIIARSYGPQLREFSFKKYASYLWMRLARIYPLHLVILLLYLSIPVSILTFSSSEDISGRFDLTYYLLSIFLLQNWGFTNGLDWNFPAWSISTEWLAYILFPLMLAATGVMARLRLLGVLALSLLLGVAVVFASLGGLSSDIPHYGAVRCVLEFWAGLCLFQLAPANPSRLSRAGAALVFVALCAAQAGLGAPDYLVMPAAFMCLVFALCRDDGIVSAVLANPVLHWLGTISYSTYLVHIFVREWVKFILVRDGIPPSVPLIAFIAATVAASALLYRYVELPGRTALRKLAVARALAGSDGPTQMASKTVQPAKYRDPNGDEWLGRARTREELAIAPKSGLDRP